MGTPPEARWGGKLSEEGAGAWVGDSVFLLEKGGKLPGGVVQPVWAS